MGGETVQESRVVRNLGVLFDRHLSWEAHVTSVVNKCIGLLIGLRHLRQHLPRNEMLTIVRSLILSRVNYWIVVYCQRSAQNERKLLKVINFAACVVIQACTTGCRPPGTNCGCLLLTACVTQVR